MQVPITFGSHQLTRKLAMENNTKLPLLATYENGQPADQSETPRLEQLYRQSSSFTFIADQEDINPINGVQDFFREFFVESKKLWFLAGPAIFTSVCQYSVGAVTQIFAGQVGTIELAAVSVENNVVIGFAFGVMWGMGSALETLCGQAYGAGQVKMLGVYMQRSWIILNTTAFLLMFIHIFAAHILRFIGQTPDISKWAGTFAIWMIPQIFAYAMNFPVQKFLQAQSKIMAMAVISALAIVGHVFLSWLLMLKLGWGLAGAAVALNLSWWFIVLAQMAYVFQGACGHAWSGFSVMAFHDLSAFVKLSMASAVMLCLEFWYYTVLVVFAGYLKNAEIAVDAFSICINILGWTLMVAFGFNAAISVRVSNELGARHPRSARFSVVVVIIASFLFGIMLSLILVAARSQYPVLFSNNKQVQQAVMDLTPLLATSIVINNVQLSLSGVAVGAGWQSYVAYVNIICYYLFGVPAGLLLGYICDMGVRGIWYGMLSGSTVQAVVLILMVCKTNWDDEAAIAEERIKKWGGEKHKDHNNVS